MRVIVFFDLPVLTVAERRNYNRFRKYLVNSGFVMMQESVYSKLCLNATASKKVIDGVRCHKPEKGMIELLTITENQYASIEYILGESNSEYITSTDRIVVL